MIKLFKPYVSWRAKWEVLKTLSSGMIAEGPRVKQFEHEFAKKFGLTNVVAVNSGTSALELAYELAGIGAGDEVLVPVLTCTATNIPLVRRGARIVFADISPDLNVNIHDIEKKITKKTKAIVFVHFGGNNRGLKEVQQIARERGIIVIEDAAQAVGSSYWGTSEYSCVSLQAIKSLTSGDGGLLICKDGKDAQKARRLRWFGYDRELKHKMGDTDLKEAGWKFHMNDISAAIGLGNLRSLDKVLAHRKALARIYRSYGLFAHAWLAGGYTIDFEATRARYKELGIEIGAHHYRNDKYTLFKKYKSKVPMMDKLEGKYFFVPNHYGVSRIQAHIIGRLYTK